MKKLRIGYVPLSKTLDSPGDRRRIVFWATARGHTLVTDLSERVDAIVASEKADFNAPVFSNSRAPIIFDLIDAYLSPTNPIEDMARGVAKNLTGQISGIPLPFSRQLSNFCSRAALVVCSTIEQESVINLYNKNTRVILDSHDEIPFIVATDPRNKTSNRHRVLWEGQPATLAGVGQISSVLATLSKSNALDFDFVTDLKYFKLLNKFFQADTSKLLEQNLSEIYNFVNLIPWSIDNLVNHANRSTIAMIPINLNIPMQFLKPENRLLIMWRLGLPCLTSASPAYIRVASKAGVSAVCANTSEWTANFSRVLGDDEFAMDEVIKGQEYLRENHNRDILLQKWDSVFESVLG
jgi:hypothetical protein